VDQGADRNFISKPLIDKLRLLSLEVDSCNICGGNNNLCVKTNKVTSLTISLHDKRSIKRTIKLDVTVLDNIGKQTIIEHDFITLFPALFMSEELIATVLPRIWPLGETNAYLSTRKQCA
jgi:hypothetical protein